MYSKNTVDKETQRKKDSEAYKCRIAFASPEDIQCCNLQHNTWRCSRMSSFGHATEQGILTTLLSRAFPGLQFCLDFRTHVS